MMLRGLGELGTVSETCGGTYATDPGFVEGFMGWFNSAPAGYTGAALGTFGNLADINAWTCQPMMQLGSLALPALAIGAITFLMGRGSRR